MKIEIAHNAGNDEYTLLGLTSEIPSDWRRNHVMIDGITYDVAIVYDLPKSIAVKGQGDFLNKEIFFC